MDSPDQPEPDPRDPRDPRRHRSFGPLPQHTNQCIRDAALWGFCDHTRLVTAPQVVARKTQLLHTARRRHRTRELLAYVGLAAVVLTTVYLTPRLGWATLWVIPAFSLGWLLVFTCGLPRAFTDGPDDILPPDAARRLHGEIAPPPRSRRPPHKPSSRP
jgi:hypothetical protein